MKAGGGSRWTMLIWSGAALLLSVPFFAMKFTSEVNWTAGDFLVMGVMLAAVCGAIELAVRTSGNWAYRGGVAAAIIGAFLITLANLAVGIVGSEDNPANLLFFGALLVGLVGAVLARFRAAGMAKAVLTTAAAVGLAFVIAALGGTEEPDVPHLREALATVVIASPLLFSAWLFRKAARV